MRETSGIPKQQEQAKQECDWLKDLGPIWRPAREPGAKERGEHGDIVLTSMAEAVTRLDDLKAQMEPAQGEQFKTDFEFFRGIGDEIGANLALLGRETVDKVRQAVYVRIAARYLEQNLQSDLRHRFGAASDSWLEDLWQYVEIEAGTVGVYTDMMEGFFKAAYEAHDATLEADWRAAREADRTTAASMEILQGPGVRPGDAQVVNVANLSPTTSRGES